MPDTSTELEFGLMLMSYTIGSPGALRKVATTAEESGFDVVLIGDHITIPEEIPDLYPYSPTGEAPHQMERERFEVFGMLSFLSGVTQTMRVGTNVCIVPYRHPVLLAKIVLTLNALSDERFDFGVGVGWMKPEFEVLDVPFGERGSRTNEFLEMFEQVCRKGAISFNGEHHQFQKTGFYPVPEDRTPPPIWVGGSSPAAIYRTARFGVGWSEMVTEGFDPDELVTMKEKLKQAFEQRNREDEPKAALGFPLHLADDSSSTSPVHLLFGNRQAVLDRIGTYRKAGLDRLLVTPHQREPQQALGKASSKQIEQIQRFGEDIIGHFK